MHDRLLAAVGERTYRHVGELTNTHPETVRRYLQGQSPSVEFVAALAEALGINADWLITGRGPMKTDQLKAHALATADTSELMHAMAETIDRLVDRMQRVEVYMQTLEARVRGQQHDDSRPNPAVSVSSPPRFADPIVVRPGGVEGTKQHGISTPRRSAGDAGRTSGAGPGGEG